MTDTPRPGPGLTSRRADRHQRRSRLPLLLASLVVVLVAAGLVVWLVVLKDDGGNDAKQARDAISAGLALQAKGDLAGAYAKYNEALTHERNNKFALYDLAVVDALQSNPGLAEQHYRQALAVDPHYEPAMYNLAIVEQTLGNTRYALSLYQQAVQTNPSDASAHFNLALMLRATGDVKDGDAQMRIARQLNPQLKDPGVPTGSATPAGGASPTK
jgi:tetratricopeptide (TPR) repeat protein